MRVIKRINAKIGVLERRVGHLESRLADLDRREASKNFDRQEMSALEDAIVSLRYHSVYQRAETSPSLALDELVEALEADKAGRVRHPRVAEAIARARSVLSIVEGVEQEAG